MPTIDGRPHNVRAETPMDETWPDDEPRRDSSSRMRPLYALIACIIILLSVAVPWWLLTSKPRVYNPCIIEGDPGGFILTFEVERNPANWTLVSHCTVEQLSLQWIMLTLYNTSGAIIEPVYRVPLANLTLGNWQTYGVLYQRVGQEDYVQEDARIIVDKVVHPSAMAYVIASMAGILDSGLLI